MDFDSFYKLFVGTGTNFDVVSGNQCEGLSNYWSRSIGGPRFTGQYAYEIFDQFGDFYEQVVNSPEAVPQKGDIVVWAPEFNGGAGHTGIATGIGDTNTFEVFESNDPVGSGATLKSYNYDHVKGWLHPKSLPQVSSISQAEVDQLRTDRDNNWNAFVSVCTNLGVTPNPDNKTQSMDECATAIIALKTLSATTPSDPTEDVKAKYPTVHNLFSELIALLHHSK